MGIGTSLGAFHEDEFAHVASPWMEKPEDIPDNNVIDPEVDPGSTKPITNLILPVSDTQDWRDYSNVGNTPVDNPDKYIQWRNQLSFKLGRDLSKDSYDYDLQGAYMQGVESEGGHLPDTFKKPNHPTFSDQSIYHGGQIRVEGEKEPFTMEGGSWGKDSEGDTFTPGSSNLHFHTTEELIDYFKKNEPNAKLILPGS